MLEIIPLKKPIDAKITIQGAKNYSLRAQFCACYAEGESLIENSLVAEDLNYTADALRAFGNVIEKNSDGSYNVIGLGDKMKNPQKEVYVEGSGVAMRFLTSYAALAPGEKILTGNERMCKRPIQNLLDGLKQLGVDCYSQNNDGFPPVVIKSQGIEGGTAEIAGNISSQFFSSICLAAPYAKNDISIKVQGDLTSKAHAAATFDIMKDFGIEVENQNFEIIKIKAGQKYNPREYYVEGDWPSASYFFGIAAITGSAIRIYGLNPDSVQGEKCLLTALEKMGCKIKVKGYIELIGPKELKGINFSDNNLTDASQTLMVVAAFADGKTTIRNLENLRLKESDRITDTARELKKMGCSVEEYPDGLTITPGSLRGAEIETYNDHRMAMSFAMAGTKIAGIKIKNPECVGKSYINYWEDLKKFGVVTVKL
jgi:3-phosphoshikimate 1-carboxyvinyltransferase